MTNFLVAFIPLFGTTVNDILLRAWRATLSRARESRRVKTITPLTWWQYFRPAFVGIVSRTVVGTAAIAGGLQVPIVWKLKSPGLALLGLLVLGLAVHQLYLGVGDAKRIREEGETQLAAWLRSRGTLIGLGMFRVAFATAIIVLIDFGFKLYWHR